MARKLIDVFPLSDKTVNKMMKIYNTPNNILNELSFKNVGKKSA